MSAPAAAPRPTTGDRAFAMAVAGIFLVALGLRVAYFLQAEVAHPVRGDIAEYFAYAYNLVEHATFSSAAPGSAAWPPDAWRGPGYPAFLAACLKLAGSQEGGYRLAVWLQLLLSAAVAPGAVAWTRRWLPRGGALAVGAMVAIWPHQVVFASTLLSETVFGALLLACAWLGARADGARGGAAAGLASGAATWVNPLALLLAPIYSLLLWREGRTRAAVALLVVHLLCAGAWSARNAMHPGMRGNWERASANLVQGSWPLYHAAYNARRQHPEARELLLQIAAEEQLIAADPEAGLAAVGSRIASAPAQAARWYVLEKPYALWSWWVRIGWGDVHYLQTGRTPYKTSAFFRATHWACRTATPALFVLALAAALLAWRRRSEADSGARLALRLAAALFLYVTVVHAVLQADPRYAVAYRPFELALAVTALVMAARAWRRWRHAAPPVAARSREGFG